MNGTDVAVGPSNMGKGLAFINESVKQYLVADIANGVKLIRMAPSVGVTV